MKILVINCGSSSLKYQLMDMENTDVLCKGLVERIGIDGSRIKHKTNNGRENLIEEPIEDHKKAMKLVMDSITSEEFGSIKSVDEISAVGHRVVHGGESFNKSVLINDEIMKTIKDCIELAPLHNPANVMGIEACKELMPNIPMSVVFDTAFHQTMEIENYIYALPYEYYEKYKIRRYGFHGTSHNYVAHRVAEMMDKDIKDLKIVTCHLGNGSSIAAVNNGKCIDTTMGFTPLEGVPMGTRCGDMDPAIVPFLMEKEGLSIKEINNIMNKKSGVLGMSGISSDFRDIEDASEKGDKRATMALNNFCNRVKKYVGAYSAQMGGIDVLVFTAGVGENSDIVRKNVCKNLEFLGIEIDLEANSCRGKEQLISTANSKVKVFVVPTNEELMIAKDTLELISK